MWLVLEIHLGTCIHHRVEREGLMWAELRHHQKTKSSIEWVETEEVMQP